MAEPTDTPTPQEETSKEIPVSATPTAPDFEAQQQLLMQQLQASMEEWNPEELDKQLSQLQSHIAQEEEHLQEVDEEEAAAHKSILSHHKGQLKALQQQFADKIQAHEAEKAAIEQANLDKKWHVVQEIKTLTATSERIHPALQRMKELQSEWRKTGNVPAHAFQQLRNAYNYEVDRFFYTISIYRDLRDLDLQKNLIHKQELVQKMQALHQEPMIRRMEMMVKALQEEWEEAGPVPHNDWDAVRDAFYQATDQVYEKIQAHYDVLRSQMEENLAAKQQLVTQARQLSGLQLKSPKKWGEKTEDILQLQQQWKKIGRVPREQNEPIWEAFRGACDQFFQRKRQYFAAVRQKQEEGKSQKEVLLQQATVWKDSEDWKAATQALIQLQKAWKEAAPADRATEQKLWESFRDVCDGFFERKKSHFANLEGAQKENAEKKQGLIKTVEQFTPSDDRKADFELLKSWAKEWQSIGHVPRKEMDKINASFKKALDAQYAKLKGGKGEKGTYQYQARIDLMAEMPDSQQALRKERQFLKGKIRRLEEELQQYEDNLSRFRITTKDSPLVKDMQGRLKKIETQIERMQEQLDVVENALQ